MAHFAELNENNEVIHVAYMDNEIITDENGNEIEQLGIDHLHRHHGSHRRWLRTSYGENFRGRYAGPGSIYKEDLDVFTPPKHYPSWVLNETTGEWEAPKPKPNDYFKDYEWIEDSQTWFSIKEYVYETYAKDYNFSDIEKVVSKYNLEDFKLVPLLSTEDYVVRIEKVKNFIITHVTYYNWSATVLKNWKNDYIENILKKANCDLFIAHKVNTQEKKSKFYNYLEVATDYVVLEEKHNCIICKRNKYVD